jgi:hypothetical protein
MLQLQLLLQALLLEVVVHLHCQVRTLTLLADLVQLLRKLRVATLLCNALLANALATEFASYAMDISTNWYDL